MDSARADAGGTTDAGGASAGNAPPLGPPGPLKEWTAQKLSLRMIGVDGPVWFKDGFVVGEVFTRELLLFVPATNNLTLFSKREWQPTGNTLDPMGRLVTVEAGNGSEPGQVVRFLDDTRTETLVALSDNLPGASDIVFHRDSGTLYIALFTGGRVVRVSWSGGQKKIDMVDGISNPQGVALSPDQRTLFAVSKAADAQRGEVYRYPVAADGSTGPRMEPAFIRMRDVTFMGRSGELDRPLGLMVDRLGYLYVSGNPEVAVFRPDGKIYAVIKTVGGGDTTNCAYAGDGKTLYVSSYGGLFKVTPDIPGL
jgi:sugar lactone lactonase YvrE